MKKKNVKKELVKSRKFKNLTPGQDRDFETLDANRMFKAYEEIEIDEYNVSISGKDKDRKIKRYGSSSGGNLSITPKGDEALKKGDHKLSITPKGSKAL